jgi:hypothetical protein
MTEVQIPGRSYHTSGQDSAPKFSGALADAIFSKKIMKSPLPNRWIPSDIEATYDKYNQYTLNSYNCRGPEFATDVDFIFAGCSQTFGIGVPDDGVWPEFVSKALSGSYVNLSMLGAGMEWITDSIYRYIHTFGSPKRGIMVLAPDMYRVNQMVNGRINRCSDSSIHDYLPQYYSETDKDLRLITQHLKHKDSVTFIRKPFEIEDTTIEEESIRRTIKAIKDLEIFCDQIGIPLIWGTWSETLAELASSLPSEYRFGNYIDVGDYSWETRLDDTGTTQDYVLDKKNNMELICHSEIQEEYHLAFAAGTDRFKFNDGQHHIGVHTHIHIADALIQRALELGV